MPVGTAFTYRITMVTKNYYNRVIKVSLISERRKYGLDIIIELIGTIIMIID